MKKFFLAIDDTDNQETRGTGFRARQLCQLISESEKGEVISAVRHQLFVHKEIPMTSHNSSACIELHTNFPEEIYKLARNFLIEIAADGSDVGLCFADENSVNDEIINWGKNAKKEILTKSEAFLLAKKNNIQLEGLTGTQDGIIGALAAVGLRKFGNDGRIIWLKGKELRDIKGIYSLEKLKQTTNIEEIKDTDFKLINKNITIDTGEWMRPVVINNKITLIVEPNKNNKNEWKIASKDFIKSISN